MKLTYECRNGEQNQKIIIENDTEDANISEVLEMVEGILKAAGYIFEGHLDIVEEL